MNIWNAIIESVMCKAHIGDAYCIAAASANTKLNFDDGARFWEASHTNIGR